MKRPTRHRMPILSMSFFILMNLEFFLLRTRPNSWIIWALMPAVVGIAAFILGPILMKTSSDYRVPASKITSGSRFSRIIGDETIVRPVFQKWARDFGYKLYSKSVDSKEIYIRYPFGMMPILVSVQSVQGKVQFEAWTLGTGKRTEKLTANFSVSLPNRIGVSNVNKLFEELRLEPIAEE